MSRDRTPHASVPRRLQEHATQIADAVSSRWYRAHGSGRLDVPLSTVAALALVGQRDPDGPAPDTQLRELTAEDFTGWARAVWTQFVNARPDLTHLVYPITGWLFADPDPNLREAAKATADAALTAGLLELTGTGTRYDVDVLGVVLTTLKANGATKARAQIYTPTDIADALALSVLTDPQPGESICDPAVGTGGLFRAAAKTVRAHGGDPASMLWIGCDIDELAIAGAAVNSLIWGLGYQVLLHVGNALTDDWVTEAQQRRAEVIRLAATIRRDKAMIRLFAAM